MRHWDVAVVWKNSDPSTIRVIGPALKVYLLDLMEFAHVIDSITVTAVTA